MISAYERIKRRLDIGDLPNGDESPRIKSETDWHWRRAINLANKIGIEKITRVYNTPDVQWDGETVFADSAYNLIHEIAHFQIAAPDRRNTPNYGLGPGPNDRGVGCETTASTPVDEEVLASLLGIMWEVRLGFAFAKSLELHGWGRFGHDDLPSRTRELEDLGLVVNGEPQPRGNIKHESD